jgi:hypothetical protein
MSAPKAKSKVALWQSPMNYVVVEQGATKGATVGVDLLDADGEVVDLDSLKGAKGDEGEPGPSGGAYTRQLVTAASYVETSTTGEKALLCDCTANAITINLPTAAGNVAKFHVKKIDASANTVTVDPAGGETIDGGATAVLQVQSESIDLVSDGTNWVIV